MAKLIKNYDVMSFGQSFSRLNGQPLDNTSIYYSLAEAEAYALLDKAYVGQPIAVIDEVAGKTTLYVIGTNNNLEQVGALPDGLSLDLHEGKLELKGFNSAENGTLPMIENGALVWKTLEDIGAGDGNDDTTYEITGISKGEGDAAEIYGIQIQAKFNGQNSGEPILIPFDVYTKSEVDAVVGGLDDRIKALEEAEDADTTYSVKEGEKILKLEGTEFSTVASLKYVEAADEEPAKIQLLGIDNAVVSEIDATPFIRDGMLSDVEYDAETNTLTFTWNTAAGEMSDTVVLSDIIEPYTAGNGLELSGNEFAVKVDSESEAFLTVGENGVKLAGVQDAIDTAANGAKSGALTEVANNYYNKTEVYNKEEVYNKNEVYAKSEVYTKGEADQAIADKISEVNGGESAGEVLGQLNAYKKTVNMEVWGDETGTGDENGNSRIDVLTSEVQALKNVGSQANVIEAVKVNGTALPITDKAVDVTVPTMLSQLDGYTGIDERITAAQNTANNAQTAANEAKGTAAQNAAAITLLQQADEGLIAAKNDHAGRIQALETAKGEHDAAYTALKGIVDQNVIDIASKAPASDLAAVSAKASANETAIGILNDTTIPGLNTEIGKKANAADVYTKTEIGTPDEGKTIVQMIKDAQTAATYDDSELRGLISGEESRATAAEGALSGRLDTVEDFFKAVETPDEVIDTLAEIVSYIESDKSGAATMAGNIKANTDAIAAINNETDGILAQAKKYTDDSIAALPFATAEKAGLVKSSSGMDKITVAEDGTMEINQISVSKLHVSEDDEFVLNGGGAAGY